MNAQDLKNSILQLAVQGKLVEQRAEEGTARELLEQIKLEKDQLIKDKKIKKSKPLPEITEDEIPFEIPETWEWVRLDDISTVITKGTTPRGGNVSYLDSGIGFLRAENVAGFDKISYDNMKYIDEETHLGFLKRSIIDCNDILITIAGTLGRTGLVRKEDLPLNANQAVAIIRLVDNNLLDLKYLIYGLNAPQMQNSLIGQKKITAIPNLTLEIIANCIIPVPPLAEQHRIVAKIEEILPYIEQYDKAYTKLEIFNEKFPEDMKKSILQLAMQGKLVEQRPEEGTADELYEQIAAEKAQLIKDGKIKKEKLLPEITEDEIPFEIPASWNWKRLGELLVIERGGSPRPIKNYLTDSADGINWIKIGDTNKGGKYINSTAEKIIPEGMKKSRYVQAGDFLLSNSMSFGRPYILNIDGCIHDGWLVLRQPVQIFERDYLYYLLSSQMVYNQFCNRVAGAVVNNLNSDKVALTVVPIPPLAEQKRIVAKIEELLPYCDRLMK